MAFMYDLRRRVSGTPTIVTDGFQPYIDAVRGTFGRGAHYAQVVKTFRASQAPRLESYRPAHRVTTKKYVIQGNRRRRRSAPAWSSASTRRYAARSSASRG